MGFLRLVRSTRRGARTFRLLCLAAAGAAGCPGGAHAATEDCAAGPVAGAAANAASYATLAWAPFGRPETGWQVYYPRITVEIGTRCPPEAPGFAAAIARWQAKHRLQRTGLVDADSFGAMKSLWQRARAFVRMGHDCPPPPPTEVLVTAASRESYHGKTIVLRPRVLAAYRAMIAAARADDRAIAREERAFRIFSAFRDPNADSARCASEGNCDGTRRATCSAHRTGLAIDIWVGQAPGFGPDASADANRRAMVATREYRWLLANAARFGFVNYAFEPWHWEWTGEPI